MFAYPLSFADLLGEDKLHGYSLSGDGKVLLELLLRDAQRTSTPFSQEKTHVLEAPARDGLFSASLLDTSVVLGGFPQIWSWDSVDVS